MRRVLIAFALVVLASASRSAQDRSTSIDPGGSVRELAEREGLTGLKFKIDGFAATHPVVPNTKPDGSDDPDGRQKNRRVEIVFGRR